MKTKNKKPRIAVFAIVSKDTKTWLDRFSAIESGKRGRLVSRAKIVNSMIAHFKKNPNKLRQIVART